MNTFNDLRANHLAKYFYQLAEQSRDVFWIRSNNLLDQMYISPTFEESWGITPQALYDNPVLWVNSVHPDDRERVVHRLMSTFQNPPGAGEIVENNYRIVRPDNTIRWIKDTTFSLYDNNNECFGFAGICKDVTKDVLYSQELEEAKQHAEMANQAKADFLAKMSHEFRTPLNAIIGITQIMQKKGVSAEYNEYISLISQAGNSLLSLVNDILDFAKIEIGELSFRNDPLDLHLLISQVIHSFKYQAEEKNIRLKLDFTDKTPRFVLGDSKRIRQILVNLISNAIKFTQHGEVSVNVNHELINSNHHFIIDVKDNGIGIDPSKHQYIFEKFAQIESFKHRKQQGTGLGLSITKQLVEHMEGTIKVESVLGAGATFTFTLPLKLLDSYQSANTNLMNNHQVNISNEMLNLNILVVEDNLVNQRVIKYMLEGIGCVMEIANDGNEAFSILEQQTNFDVIFMDVGLPNMDGFEVTTKIRQMPACANIPIIAMTAHALECDQQKCFESGMNHIIIKPIRYEELFQLLKSLC